MLIINKKACRIMCKIAKKMRKKTEEKENITKYMGV